MLGVLVVMAALGSMAACGGGGSSAPPPQKDPGTTAGTYTYTVQATGNPSVGAVSTTFAVTVN
jgi:predicted small lipoprotein YifL